MGGLSRLLLAGERDLTAQEARNSLLSLIMSPQFEGRSEEEYLTREKCNFRYVTQVGLQCVPYDRSRVSQA